MIDFKTYVKPNFVWLDNNMELFSCHSSLQGNPGHDGAPGRDGPPGPKVSAYKNILVI